MGELTKAGLGGACMTPTDIKAAEERVKLIARYVDIAACDFITDFLPGDGDAIRTLLALIAEQQVEREPVGYTSVEMLTRTEEFRRNGIVFYPTPSGTYRTPLYTAPPPPEQQVESGRLREALERIAAFKQIKPVGDAGSYQRGYDNGFNNAGLHASGIALEALSPSPAHSEGVDR